MKKMMTLAALLAPAVGLAADMKPGNWEYKVTMEIPGMPFQMPAQTFKQCVTAADIQKNKQFQSQDKSKECETKNLKQSPGKASFDIACKDGTTGHSDYTYTGDSLTGKTAMKTGEGQVMNMSTTSKRTGDC